MRINPQRSSKIVAVGIAASMLLTVVSACAIDYDGLSEGLNELGIALDLNAGRTPATPAETTESEATTSESSKETSDTATETTESTVSTESTETSSSTSTSDETTGTSKTSETIGTSEISETSETTEETTPTPTPTPRITNERVDFSKLTTSNLSDKFAVDTEEFSENVEGDGKAMAVFSGKRMVVSKAGSDNVTEAVNLILDSFYQEAVGVYNRYAGEAKAAYNISGTIDTVYNIEVNFDYSFNSRILSVVMSYKATVGNNVLTSKEEFASFDMLTGQYITLASITDDWTGLQDALKLKLAKNISITRPAAITDLYVTAQQPGAQTATIEIYGMYNGQMIHTTGDMNEYAKFLNRYGKMIYGVTEDNGNAQ